MPRELTESDVFVLLTNRRRRALLEVVRESSTPLSTTRIAERIGERECTDPSDEDRRAIYLSLYHHHLPRLDEADVVVYDADEGTVTPGLNFDDLVGVLDEVSERNLTWADT